MPSEMVQETIQWWVTPTLWQRGPGHSVVAINSWSNLDADAGETRPGGRGEGAGKPSDGGVYVSEHLSIVAHREGLFLEDRGQNRTRENRLSGIEGGLVET